MHVAQALWRPCQLQWRYHWHGPPGEGGGRARASGAMSFELAVVRIAFVAKHWPVSGFECHGLGIAPGRCGCMHALQFTG